MKKFFAVLCLGGLFFSCAHARPHPPLPEAKVLDPSSLERAILEGDHALLAKYYRQQAEREREAARIHDKFGTSYRSSPHYHRTRQRMTEHCHRLKWEALKRAKLLDGMADEEERLIPSNH